MNRHERGGAMTAMLVFLVGIALGIAGGIAPRFYGVDPMNWIKPPVEIVVEETTAEEKPIASLQIQEAELKNMIIAIKKQESGLLEREKPLLAREQSIEQQRVSLESIKSQIDQAEQRVRKLVIEIKADELKNLKNTAKMWAAMDPENVSKLIAALPTTPDPDFAAKVLFNMSQKQVAPIFDAMSASTDASTSKLVGSLSLKLQKLKLENEPKGPSGG